MTGKLTKEAYRTQYRAKNSRKTHQNATKKRGFIPDFRVDGFNREFTAVIIAGHVRRNGISHSPSHTLPYYHHATSRGRYIDNKRAHACLYIYIIYKLYKGSGRTAFPEHTAAAAPLTRGNRMKNETRPMRRFCFSKQRLRPAKTGFAGQRQTSGRNPETPIH